MSAKKLLDKYLQKKAVIKDIDILERRLEVVKNKKKTIKKKKN